MHGEDAVAASRQHNGGKRAREALLESPASALPPPADVMPRPDRREQPRPACPWPADDAAPPAICRRAVVTWLLGAAALPAYAVTPLPSPQGAVVLTISGKIAVTNAGSEAKFDMAMLEAFAQHSFVTRTPWYPGPMKFTGPLLRDVLDAVGAHGTTLRAFALNDYRVDLPFDDAVNIDVLVARLLNDRPMSVRDKGPLFIIYPFDSSLELRNALYYSRAAWQLKAIEVS